MRAFWPVAESAQADYEVLRESALCGLTPAIPAAAIFRRAGLAGLIARPVSGAAFVAHLHPGRRPPWQPYGDPRVELLADAFELILAAAPTAGSEGAAR